VARRRGGHGAQRSARLDLRVQRFLTALEALLGLSRADLALLFGLVSPSVLVLACAAVSAAGGMIAAPLADLASETVSIISSRRENFGMTIQSSELARMQAHLFMVLWRTSVPG
jgi:hypothetical protein